MIVVSDTSPILNLAIIGNLHLLPALYQEVLIPSAVFDELTWSPSNLPPAISLAAEPWLTVATPLDRKRVHVLREDLDTGEAEAIALVIERGAGLVLIDERRGRRMASASGLKVMGLLGSLAAAKQSGLIQAVKPLLDDLIILLRPEDLMRVVEAKHCGIGK